MQLIQISSAVLGKLSAFYCVPLLMELGFLFLRERLLVLMRQSMGKTAVVLVCCLLLKSPWSDPDLRKGAVNYI